MTLHQPIYLDYNATTPIAPEVRQAMEPFLHRHFGNPSSAYVFGRIAKEAVEKAREQVAGLVDCSASEIVFSSGGTESNNHAIKGLAYARKSQGMHIISSAIEHPAVLEVCRFLERQGFAFSIVPVDKQGVVDLEVLQQLIRPDTVLISIMHANNEVGTIQPIKKVSQIARAHQITFHCDAAQSLGKIPVSVNDLGVDLLSLAGHKLYAPKGVGALYVREGTVLEKFMHGAGQESGLRGGTENVLEIVGLGEACDLAERTLTESSSELEATRDALFEMIREEVDDVVVNGHPSSRLPNTLSLSFPGLCSIELLDVLEGKVAVSAGSACHAADISISPVLEAMGLNEEIARGTLRFSTGRLTTMEDVEQAASLVVASVNKIRNRAWTRVKKRARNVLSREK